jgi:geranylgeranyl diphosphate synthase type II
MKDIEKYLASKRKLVDKALRTFLPKRAKAVRLLEAMRYSVLSNGKRLRPILAIAAYEACGGKGSAILPAACAIEYIHAFSLIHDDLPIIDNSDLRRGKPTAHVKFGDATALLAGDALALYAFEAIARYTDRGKVSPRDLLEVLRSLLVSVGISGVVAGEELDIEFEGRSISPDRILEMYRLKTASLIEASVICGAIIAGAPRAKVRALSAYGRNIGLAFQLHDDILDAVGRTSVIGKRSGSDSRRRKATYAAHVGVEGAVALADRCVESAVRRLKIFGPGADALRLIARYVVSRSK